VAAAAAVEWSSVQFQWSGQCERLCFVLVLASGLVFEAFPFPSSGNRVQVPCLTWLFACWNSLPQHAWLLACQPVLSWPRIRSLYALYMLTC
jgi:hypothetical protein